MAAKKPPRKEFDPKSVKQGIADPGLGRIARGAAAVGRAAYKAGSVRAVDLARQAAKAEARSGAGVGARKINVRNASQRSGRPTDLASSQVWGGAGKMQSIQKPTTGRRTNKSSYPTSTVSSASKKMQSGVGARKKK